MYTLTLLLTLSCISTPCPAEPGSSWTPYRPAENSTLQVVKDPDAFATRNQKFTWELHWTPQEQLIPGTEIELRSANLRTFYEWQYSRIDMEGADITMRRPIQINSDYVFSVAPDWILARAKLQYGLDPDQVLRIRLIAIPPQFTEVDDVLSLWIGKKEKGQEGLQTHSPGHRHPARRAGSG